MGGPYALQTLRMEMDDTTSGAMHAPALPSQSGATPPCAKGLPQLRGPVSPEPAMLEL